MSQQPRLFITHNQPEKLSTISATKTSQRRKQGFEYNWRFDEPSPNLKQNCMNPRPSDSKPNGHSSSQSASNQIENHLPQPSV
ncbi:hypothetical protein E1A91_D12G196800v1 [Gossypium mustelinum]|uniref:Uncharacterized protein n=1 Tax=Gossypium mustelinum TaxID=34275 RepID=A0A5D2SGT3_GOSMU|nr:hypothetical protein E1A91_D12G196800v1 [Gossypium mustelinum]